MLGLKTEDPRARNAEPRMKPVQTGRSTPAEPTMTRPHHDEERTGDGKGGFAEGFGEAPDDAALDENDDEPDPAEKIRAWHPGRLSR